MLFTGAPADQVESGPADSHRAVARNLVALVLGLRIGRIWPRIISHALYDAWSIGMGVVTVSRMMPG